MSWLNDMAVLQKRLVKNSPYTLSDELFNAVNVFRELQNDVLRLGSKTNTVSPFWMKSSYFLTPPVNPKLIVMKGLQEVAEQEGVPLTWLYLLPFHLQIDSAARHVSFMDSIIHYVDDEGYATSECLIAFHDGKEEGLIDDDEPFVFAVGDFIEKYSEDAKEAVETLSGDMGVSTKDFIKIISGEHIDAPFPYENDDSLWGDV